MWRGGEKRREPKTKKGSAFPQTLISFLVELRRIELLTS